MLLIKRSFPFCLAVLFCCVGIVHASYTIVLKNGRRITVKSYREEGEMIKVRGMGGEFGIAKEQIESIINPGEDEEKGMVVPESNRVESIVTTREMGPNSPETQKDQAREGDAQQKKAKATASKGNEEADYLSRIKAKDKQLEQLRNRYTEVTRGATSSQTGILKGQEAIKGRTADLQSRLKDAQRSRAATGAGGAARVDVPPPAYSAKEKELSELRKRIAETQNERDALVSELKQKNFGSGSRSE